MGTEKGYLAGDTVGVIYLGLKLEVGTHLVTRKEKPSGRWKNTLKGRKLAQDGLGR